MSNRYKNYALAMAPVAAILLTLGCSSSKQSLSTNSKLAGLKVSGPNGAMTPGFAAGTLAYTLPTVYSANPGSITITPATDNEKATVTVNGLVATSFTASAPIPLKVGNNVIPVVVTAEDGKTVTTYTVSCTIYAQNTSLQVLDSINGNVVPSATLTVTDAAGKVLQSGIPVDAKGKATLGLDGASKYNLIAQGAGSAQSMIQGFDSSKETAGTFYCQPLGMIAFPAIAPQITYLGYAPVPASGDPTAASFTTFTESISDKLANIKLLAASALGASGVDVTSWSGYGMNLAADGTPYVFSPASILAMSSPTATPVGDATYYSTDLILAVPTLSSYAANTQHYLDLVTYDVANNRTEKKIYVNVTDGAADTTQDDLSTLVPTGFVMQFVTDGYCRTLFGSSAAPVTHEGAAFYNLLTAAKAAAKITGIELYRSPDGASWTKIGTQTFPLSSATTMGNSGYSIIDPSIQEGVNYYYKIRCFNANTTNNGGYSQFSTPVSCAVMPGQQTNLVAPAHESISVSLTPALTFNTSNPSLFNSAMSDYFYFMLLVREKTSTASQYTQAYRYNFTLGRFEILTAGVWGATTAVTVDAAHTNFTIATPAGYFQQGVSYEWTIYGSKASLSPTSANATNFRKYTYPYNDPTSTSYGLALATGSTYEQGYGAINGLFTLTIDPNAK
jgi:hypothetical protein